MGFATDAKELAGPASDANQVLEVVIMDDLSIWGHWRPPKASKRAPADSASVGDRF